MVPAAQRSRWERWGVVGGLALLAGAVLWLGLTPIAGNDVWWHLSLGREILRTGGLVDHEVFSYTFRGAEWAYKDAGAAVLQWAAWSLGGAAGLVLLKAALFLVITALLAWILLRIRRVPPPLALILLALFVPAVAFRMGARAELFSFALFCGTILVIERHRAGQGRLEWALLLVLLNANLHRGALMSAALLGLYGGARLAQRWLWRRDTNWKRPALVFLASLLVLCLNPFGPKIVTTAFGVLGESAYRAHIAEWALATPGRIWQASPTTLALAGLALLGLGLRGRDQEPWDLALVLFGGILGLRAMRFLPFFAFCVLAPAAAGLARLPRVWEARTRHLLTVGAPLAALLWAVASPYPPPRLSTLPGRYPEQAVAFVKRTHPRGRMLNEFDDGGYLMFHFYPRYRVYIDGRNDMIYPSRFFVRFVTKTLVDPTVFRRTVDRWKIQWLFVRHRPDDRARAHIDRSRRWALVYVSERALVYLRTDGPNAALAKRLRYRVLQPYDLSRSILRSVQSGRAADALADGRRMVRQDPGSVTAHKVLARVYLLLGPRYRDRAKREIEVLRRMGVKGLPRAP